jgi:hypothetical protein
MRGECPWGGAADSFCERVGNVRGAGGKRGGGGNEAAAGGGACGPYVVIIVEDWTKVVV